MPSVALDIGCSVGRSTFELAKRFNQVVGIDFSHVFIDAANKLKMYGKLDYCIQREGSLVSPDTAEVDSDIVSSFWYYEYLDPCFVTVLIRETIIIIAKITIMVIVWLVDIGFFVLSFF